MQFEGKVMTERRHTLSQGTLFIWGKHPIQPFNGKSLNEKSIKTVRSFGLTHLKSGNTVFIWGKHPLQAFNGISLNEKSIKNVGSYFGLTHLKWLRLLLVHNSEQTQHAYAWAIERATQDKLEKIKIEQLSCYQLIMHHNHHRLQVAYRVHT